MELLPSIMNLELPVVGVDARDAVAKYRPRLLSPDQIAAGLATIRHLVLACGPVSVSDARTMLATAARFLSDVAVPGEPFDVDALVTDFEVGRWLHSQRQAGMLGASLLSHYQRLCRFLRVRRGLPARMPVHSMVDDHTRIAYSEIHPDEQADTCAGYIRRAGDYFASVGVSIERVMTDNHWSYTKSASVAAAIADLGARHKLIRPHCPWQNGKVERFNRTLQTEWAYRQVFESSDEHSNALPDFLHHYNHQRRHSTLNGQPPISRLSPT